MQVLQCPETMVAIANKEATRVRLDDEQRMRCIIIAMAGQLARQL